MFIDAFNVLEHASVSYVHAGALEGITWEDLKK